MSLCLFYEGIEYPNSGTFVPENFRGSEAENEVPLLHSFRERKKLLSPIKHFYSEVFYRNALVS